MLIMRLLQVIHGLVMVYTLLLMHPILPGAGYLVQTLLEMEQQKAIYSW